MTHATLLDPEALEISEPSVHRSLTVFPVLGDARGPDYITLREAFRLGQIRVTERTGTARVPELEVTNRGHQAILILDGEILEGAKQTRALNTTVLLAPRSQTVLPVSCVEARRWHHTTFAFSDLDAVIPYQVRWAQVESVHQSLRHCGRHRSNQGRVWEEVDKQLDAHEVRSATASMAELYRQRRKELQAYLQALPCHPRQRGMVVAIGGRVIGADILSRPLAYAQVHRRLLKGYASDDLGRPLGEEPTPGIDDARSFLREIVAGDSRHHPGIGLGEEIRTEAARGQGLALVHEGTMVHGVFLGALEATDPRRPRPRREHPIRRRRRLW